MSPPVLPLTLLYDGACPLCAREIAWLRRHADPARLHLVDVTAADYQPPPAAPSRTALLDLLHARDAAGQWYRGLDATYWSWHGAGLGHWARPLRWRPLRPLLELGYRLFLRLRPALGRLPHPRGRPACRQPDCAIPPRRQD